MDKREAIAEWLFDNFCHVYEGQKYCALPYQDIVIKNAWLKKADELLALDKTEKEILYCECKPENRLLCRAMECSICHSCDRPLPPKPSPKVEVELPEKLGELEPDAYLSHAKIKDTINALIDYLRAKGGEGE